VPFKYRHGFYWGLAVAFVALALSNVNLLSFWPVTAKPAHRNWDFILFWSIAGIVVFLAVVGLVVTVRELNHVGWRRTASRSVVLIAIALGVAAVVLYQAQRMGVHIQSCYMDLQHKKEVCTPLSSERHVFGMLAWHGSNVVPVLDIPKSLGWTRPARSSSRTVLLIILAVRLWVAIGLLAVIKRLWDKWSGVTPSAQPADTSSPPPTDGTSRAAEAPVRASRRP
jgi:hypothetical protein